MNIAYCCLLLPKEKVSAERAKKHLPGVSLHKLSKSIIAGLDENSEKNVTVFSIINTLNYPNYPKLFFESEKWSHSRESKDMYLGYINLFGVKYLTQTHSVYKNLKKWVNQAPDNEENVICVHHIYYPLMKAAIKIKRKYKKKVHVCLITGDMVGKYGLKSQSRDNIKQKLLLHVEKSIEKMVGEFDSFVFATKYMASAFGVDDKPYTVLECMYTLPSESEVENEPKETNNKIIFYAGALRHEYGIDHLLRAFSMIQDQNYKLWLAGGGNAEEEIKKYMKNDDRISFLGFISPQEVEERQKQATVLVSPRKNEGNFVKYSFPSKTMECLASGKPYIAHRLDCDPKEYESVIQYVKDDSDEALAKKIVDICSMSKEQRTIIGDRAKKFIMNEKNPKVMCRRIVDMWKKNL